jgi:hypothetical protein
MEDNNSFFNELDEERDYEEKSEDKIPNKTKPKNKKGKDSSDYILYHLGGGSD